MSVPIKYCQSMTPKPYEVSLTPVELSYEEYQALTDKWTTVEEHYEVAVSSYNDWKVAKAKEACVKLRLDKEAWDANVEALKQEAERKEAEEKGQEEERLWLEAEAKKLTLVKEQKEATECC